MGGLGYKLDIPKRLMYACYRASDRRVCITTFGWQAALQGSQTSDIIADIFGLYS